MTNTLHRSHKTAGSAFLRAFAEIEHPSTPDKEITSDDLANQLVARFNRRTSHLESTDRTLLERAEFRAWRTIRTIARQAGDLHIHGRLRKPGMGAPGPSAQEFKNLHRRAGD